MDKMSNCIADFISDSKDNIDILANFISASKDNIDAIADFIMNETPRGFDTEPTLNLAAHLETMRDSWKVSLNAYYGQKFENFRIKLEFIALEWGKPAKPFDSPNIPQIAMWLKMIDPELVATIFNKYLLPKNAVHPFQWFDKEKSAAACLADFEACLYCTTLFYIIWHSAAVRNVAACPAGLVLHMAEVSLTLSEAAWFIFGTSITNITSKALLGSQKARKSGAKALRGVVFDGICAKKPDWFRRYGVSMVSIAKDLIRETRIDRTPKQVTKYIRDGLSRGDFADTGLEEVLREIYCKTSKKGNLL